MNKYAITQLVYIVASNRLVQPVTIRDRLEDMYLVNFESSGSMWIHESRIFPSRKEAAVFLKEFKESRKDKIKHMDRLK